MKRDLEMNSNHRTERETEQKERRHDARLGVPKHRNAAADVRIPYWNLVEANHGLPGNPRQHPDQISIPEYPRLAEVRENRIAEQKSEGDRSRSNQRYFMPMGRRSAFRTRIQMMLVRSLDVIAQHD
jgi:hypothetical protein